MKQINNLLPKAMDALVNSGLVYKNDSLLKEYDGYVASFAPSVITAGIKATLSFYTDKHKLGKNESNMPIYSQNPKHPPRRFHILTIMHNVYNSIDGHLEGDDLLSIALKDGNEAKLPKLKQDLINCAIALKLVMRNFKQLDKIPSTLQQNARP